MYSSLSRVKPTPFDSKLIWTCPAGSAAATCRLYSPGARQQGSGSPARKGESESGPRRSRAGGWGDGGDVTSRRSAPLRTR